MVNKAFVVVFVASGVAMIAIMLAWVWVNIGPESAMFAVGGLLGSMASTAVVMLVMGGERRVYYTPEPRELHTMRVINPNERRVAKR